MRSFEHVNAVSPRGAIGLLRPDGHSRVIAGGTDLLSEVKLGIVTPDRLVNLKSIPNLGRISFDEAGGLRLGALATLHDISESEVVRSRYGVLAEAISVAASPQLRNAGTIGGNLCQDSRCWYYRGPFHCWLKGGDLCYAREGENARHAIFGGGPCYTVHPSDPAPALIALGAEVRVVGPEGERTLPLERLFQIPREDARRLTAIGPADVIVEVRVPTPAPGSVGSYHKAMDRRVWAFAQASVALQVVLDGDTVRDVRMVLGGVAPTPWRVPDAEAELRGRRLDAEGFHRAAEVAVAGARPLRHNGYKIALVKGIVTEALASLRGKTERG